MSHHEDIGVVVIGRNEGERLLRCLESVRGLANTVVYVDSGSTDGSIEAAHAMGADVIDLDLSTPFTAARARNAGFQRLRDIAPGVRYVQFVDGDCEVADGWLATARDALERKKSLAVVCGRRRERRPEASLYNTLADLEWDTPVGATRSCGGDALFRVEAFEQVDGFDESLIAGEEPELCFRLRARRGDHVPEGGWRVERLDAEMTLHDAAMTRFGQWWKRAVRAGHAAAEGAWLHGRSPERFNVRRVARALGWGMVLPVIALIGAIPTSGLSLLLLLLYPLQWARMVVAERKLGRSERYARLQATFSLIAKFAHCAGIARFSWGMLSGWRSGLIEYKSPSSGPSPGCVLYIGAVLPTLTETFVHREVLAMRARGVPVRVASVRSPDPSHSEEALRQLAAEAIPVYGAGVQALGSDVLHELAARPTATLATIFQSLVDVLRRWEGGPRGISRRAKVIVQCLAGIALARRCRPLGISHIHAHMAHVPTTIAMYAARQLGIGFSFTGHANDLFKERTLLRVKLRRARFTACISEWHRAWYRKIERLPALRAPIVRCGVSTERFTPSDRLPEGRPRVVSIGRLVEKKGHRVLIEAVADLLRRGADLECAIVGDGPEHAGLQRLIDELGCDERIKLAGSMPNQHVRKLLETATVFCLPCAPDSEGDMDGIPVVLMEAMASGIPVIAGDLPAIRELVMDGQTGLLVNAGDVDGCAAALERLVRDADDRERLAIAGRRRVLEEFSEHVNIDRLIAAFARIGALEPDRAAVPGEPAPRKAEEQSGRSAA